MGCGCSGTLELIVAELRSPDKRGKIYAKINLADESDIKIVLICFSLIVAISACNSSSFVRLEVICFTILSPLL